MLMHNFNKIGDDYLCIPLNLQTTLIYKLGGGVYRLDAIMNDHNSIITILNQSDLSDVAYLRQYVNVDTYVTVIASDRGYALKILNKEESFKGNFLFSLSLFYVHLILVIL